MPHTRLSHDAVRRLRQGAAHLGREDVLGVDGALRPGEAAELLDPEGRPVGVGDVDLDGPVAVSVLGDLHDTAEGLIPRQVRRALTRRTQVVDDPRFCRVINEEGDGLPGLTVDRFDGHFSVQTTTRAMDARLEQLSRTLVDVAGARSIMLRNDTRRRQQAGLPKERSRVLLGSPPRWTRIQELGARLTVDLHEGPETGYGYALREVRRAVGRLSRNARVLDPSCAVGGTVVQAGMNGAKAITAFTHDLDSLDLAKENAEANGLQNRFTVEMATPLDGLRSVRGSWDLVVLHTAPAGLDQVEWARDFDEMVQLALRATRHGGRLVIAVPDLALGSEPLEHRVVRQCEVEDRIAWRLLRPAAPGDFPALAGAPEALASVVLEIT